MAATTIARRHIPPAASDAIPPRRVLRPAARASVLTLLGRSPPQIGSEGREGAMGPIHGEQERLGRLRGDVQVTF